MIEKYIGRTPLVETNSNVFAKLEFFNAANSIKDRVASALIYQAERDGFLKKGSTVIEATSGNLGVALAMICALRGYKFIAIMLDNMAQEYKKLIEIYGGKVICVSAEHGTKTALNKVQEILAENPDFFYTNQFENPVSVAIHYNTTALEIWRDMKGDIDFFVAGVGTGATLTGVAKRLKEIKSKVKIIAVEPKSSPVLSGGKKGLHKIQGIGSGFIPPLLDMSLIDEIVQVSDEDAIETARMNAVKYGILGGISSGAAAWAANMIWERDSSKKIVYIVPSSGERQISTSLFK